MHRRCNDFRPAGRLNEAVGNYKAIKSFLMAPIKVSDRGTCENDSHYKVKTFQSTTDQHSCNPNKLKNKLHFSAICWLMQARLRLHNSHNRNQANKRAPLLLDSVQSETIFDCASPSRQSEGFITRDVVTHTVSQGIFHTVS